MKNTMKRIIAVFSVLCIASMSFVSCAKDTGWVSDSDSSSQTQVEGKPTMKYPLEIGAAASGNKLTPGDPNADLNAPDPESSADSNSGSDEKTTKEPATELVKVTEPDGQPVTELVKVTEPDGQPATDDNGEEKTEVVEVIEVVEVPAENSGNDNNNSEQGNGNQSSGNNENYVSAEDGRYAMWLDISKDENFYFEGDMLTIQFKVKEDIPDGDYEVRISPDLSDIAGNVVRPEKIISGVVRVNKGEIEAVDVSGENGLVFYGDKISCKQGDTVDMNINIKNNSGLAAFCIWFYFDSNALEFLGAGATGEFEEISRQTEIGSGTEE
ncbi:MAG: hypothetical protein K2I00_09355 [Ruminococcus sp.]|nr:hypothetical protein [Ruminococcus sp.]